MDKETLSHYGWIVILVLILAVLLAFATPFGSFIADGFKATYAGFDMVGTSAIDIISPHIHDYKETITKEPTCTEPGEKKLECECGESTTEQIPGGHEYDNNSDTTCNKCGQVSVLWKFDAAEYDNMMGTTTKTDSKIVVPESFEYNGKTYRITGIDAYGMYNLTSLTEVEMPECVKTIGFAAFWGCTSLENLTIGDGVETINNRAFDYSGLKRITLGKKVSTVGYNFNYCESLLEFVVDEENQYYCSLDGVLYSKDMKTLVRYPKGNPASSFVMPNTVITLESSSFYYCNNLKSVTFSNKLETIGDQAFNGVMQAGMKSVTLPASLKRIGYYVFGQSWSSGGYWNIYVEDPNNWYRGKSAGSLEEELTTLSSSYSAARELMCSTYYYTKFENPNDPHQCTGGEEATCYSKPICKWCNKGYGDFKPHTLSNGECLVCGAKGMAIESAHTPYANNINYNVLGTWDYSDAKSVTISITYRTENTSYDWCSITSGTDYISGQSYNTQRTYLGTDGKLIETTGTNTNVKFGGSTLKTVTFSNINMLTGSVIFRTDSSGNAYDGITVVIIPNY